MIRICRSDNCNFVFLFIFFNYYYYYYSLIFVRFSNPKKVSTNVKNYTKQYNIEKMSHKKTIHVLDIFTRQLPKNKPRHCKSNTCFNFPWNLKELLRMQGYRFAYPTIRHPKCITFLLW